MTTTARLGLIWAQARDRVIGDAGDMPWDLPEDLARFRALTMGHPVIMGRKTWDAVPERYRPLVGRRNIVLTRQADWRADGAERAVSVPEALALLPPDSTAWVMGGAQVYAAALDYADWLEVTEIDLRVAGDTVAPPIGAEWCLVAVEPPSAVSGSAVPDTSGGAAGSNSAQEKWRTSRTGLRYRYLRYERA